MEINPLTWRALMVSVALSFTAMAYAENTTDLPEAIKPPAGQQLLFKSDATGMQVYYCRPTKGDAKKFVWLLTAPDAVLYNREHQPIGKHTAGPTWRDNQSSVIGQLQSKVAADSSSAVPWLLVKAKSTSGSGPFSSVSYINRINTKGGVAPASGCNSTTVGQSVRVAYSATYYFYRAK